MEELFGVHALEFRHGLDAAEVPDALLPVVVADPGVLCPSKGQGGERVGDETVVDVHGSCLHPACVHARLFHVLAEDRSAKAILGAVGHPDRLFRGVKGHDRKDGAKGLLPPYLHLRLDPRKHGRREEQAFSAVHPSPPF